MVELEELQERELVPDVTCAACGSKLSDMAAGGPTWNVYENVTMRFGLTVVESADAGLYRVEAFDPSTMDGNGDPELVCPNGHLQDIEQSEPFFAGVRYV